MLRAAVFVGAVLLGGWYLLADTRFEDYMGWALLIPGMSAACIAFLLFD